MKGIYLTCDLDKLTGSYQLAIEYKDKDGSGTGIRLSGPKYCGMSQNIISYRIRKEDLPIIRTYLKKVKD